MSDRKVETPIADMLNRYKKEHLVRFHMPGHKGKHVFESLKCISSVTAIDITEVPGTDNLHEPKEAILDAELLLSRAYSADKSFLLINGSTCGLLAAMGAAFKPGNKVIVAENCHRAVFHAVQLFRLKAILVKDITAGKIRDILKRERGCKGVVITRPDYYGVCCDIRAIAEACHENQLKLIADEAHGAHLHFAKTGYPESAVPYADFTIQSAHKTLGALSQCAFLHLKNAGTFLEKEVRRQLTVFQTSSPSYILLASADCARAHMEEYGAELLEDLRHNIQMVIREIQDKTCFQVEQEDILPIGITRSPDRLVINTASAGFIGYAVERFLRSKSIQIEMSDKTRIVCLCSVFDQKEDFVRLVKALQDVMQYVDQMQDKTSSDMAKRQVFLNELSKKVGQEMLFDIVPYPPGTPVLRSGEVLTEDVFLQISDLYLSGANIMGLYECSADSDGERTGEQHA